MLDRGCINNHGRIGEGMMLVGDLRLMAWMDNAACKGMDSKIFFPEYELLAGALPGSNSYKTAREICNACSVAPECLDYSCRYMGRHDDRHGMWGGMTPNERGKKIRKANQRQRLARQSTNDGIIE